MLVDVENLACLTVELSVGRRLLAAPDRVRRNKGLCLGGDGRENTFLRESLAVCAASVLGLIKTGAANLKTRQHKLSLACDARCWLCRVSEGVGDARGAERVASSHHPQGHIHRTHLSPPAVSACYSSPLAWRGLGRCGVAHRRAVARVHLRGRR